MKNKEKGKEFAALFIVLLTALFAYSCKNPGNSGEKQKNAETTGMLTLRITSEASRTILPSVKEEDFDWYTLLFTDEDTGEEQFFEFPAGSLTVNLNESVYTLDVTAYLDSADIEAEKPSAYGSLANVKITAGSETAQTVTLTVLGMEEGTGFFSWDLSFPPDLEEVSMEIIPYEDTDPLSVLYFAGGTQTAPNPGTLELESGCYTVTLTLVKDNETQPVIWPEALHIYQNMESLFIYDFRGIRFTEKLSTLGSSALNFNFELIEDDDEIIPLSGFSGSLRLPLQGGENITLTLEKFSQYDSASWYIDGIYKAGTKSIILSPADYNRTCIGMHILSVIVETGGKPYSRTVEFRITEKPLDFSGDGTEENPFLLKSAADLRKLAENANGGALYDDEKGYRYAHYRLVSSVDLGGESGGGWEPVGTDKMRFLGVFDGGGFEITGLHITEGCTDQGLFGVIGKEGIIRRLGVNGVSASAGNDGKNSNGGIAGNNFGTIENCYSSVTVTGGDYAGGIAGRNRSGGKIYYCYSTGSISGGSYSGGITGHNVGSTRCCVSLGLSVNGTNSGRITGYSSGTSSNNKARDNMLVNGSLIVSGADIKLHGIDLTEGASLASVFSFFNGDIWQIPDGDFTNGGELPLLKNN